MPLFPALVAAVALTLVVAVGDSAAVCLLVRLEVGLALGGVLGLEVEPRVVPGGGGVGVLVLGEAVLLRPPLRLAARLDLGDRDVLLPVVSPVQLALEKVAESIGL